MKQHLSIHYKNAQYKYKISKSLRELIRSAILKTLELEGFDAPAAVYVTFTDNEGIRKYNNEYRGIDKATDVLSFPLNDFETDEFFDGETIELGDIILSLEKAHEQAYTYGHSLERETAFLCVHSTLHLLGYDHETGEEDENDMRYRQRRVMEVLGLGITGDIK